MIENNFPARVFLLLPLFVVQAEVLKLGTDASAGGFIDHRLFLGVPLDCIERCPCPDQIRGKHRAFSPYQRGQFRRCWHERPDMLDAALNDPITNRLESFQRAALEREGVDLRSAGGIQFSRELQAGSRQEQNAGHYGVVTRPKQLFVQFANLPAQGRKLAVLCRW